jgi:hypothetical protein
MIEVVARHLTGNEQVDEEVLSVVRVLWRSMPGGPRPPDIEPEVDRTSR